MFLQQKSRLRMPFLIKAKSIQSKGTMRDAQCTVPQATERQSSSPTQKRGFASLFLKRLLWGSAIALTWGITAPAQAAERLLLRVGPIQQSVKIEEIERFAKTGELSPGLKFYAPLFSSQVREVLNRRLQIDPKLGDKLIADLLRSPAGEQLISKIGVAIPDSSVEQVQGAIAIAARQANGLSVVSFLKAYPAETLTIDASSAVGIALEFNVPYWQSQALSSLLERELAVSNEPFHSDTPDPSAPGPQKVEQYTVAFQDRERQRRIIADFYWAKDTQGPLVIMSHGFGADRGYLAYLARHLASYGMTVVALEHPGSNVRWLYNSATDRNFSNLLQASEFIERPKDVSFLIDELEKLNEQPSYWRGKFNTQQVVVIGHSLGGYTALALAGGELNIDQVRQFCKEANPIIKAGGDWLQCAAADLPERRLQLRDRRVVEVIALNPVVGKLFGKTGLNQVNIPTLILSGTEDALTPALTHQLQPFTQLGGRKYLLSVIGGTHLSVSDPVNLKPEQFQFTLVRERVGKEAAPVRQILQGVSLAFIKQLSPEAQDYEPFLTSAYAQYLSTPGMPLRLNSSLPTSITSWFGLASVP